MEMNEAQKKTLQLSSRRQNVCIRMCPTSCGQKISKHAINCLAAYSLTKAIYCLLVYNRK